MSEKEPTAAEKLQLEYNQRCALVGHYRAQIKGLQWLLENEESQIEKILKKVQNLPKTEQKKMDSEEPVSTQSVA